MIQAEQERDKYRRMWAVPGYRQNSPGQTLVPTFLVQCPWKLRDRVIDLGCGTGRAGKALAEKGLRVTMLDFVDARDEDTKEFDFIDACLWERLTLPAFDWIFSSDVLEHIPTRRVDAVLDNMAQLTGKGGLLQIALFQDGFGSMIGETLHLTVKPVDWWMPKLEARWKIEHVQSDTARLVAIVGEPK